MSIIHEVATMTAKGQITVPKPIRQALGVDAGVWRGRHPRSSPDQRVYQQRERHHRPCRQRPARAASTNDDRVALVIGDLALNVWKPRQAMPQGACGSR